MSLSFFIFSLVCVFLSPSLMGVSLTFYFSLSDCLTSDSGSLPHLHFHSFINILSSPLCPVLAKCYAIISAFPLLLCLRGGPLPSVANCLQLCVTTSLAPCGTHAIIPTKHLLSTYCKSNSFHAPVSPSLSLSLVFVCLTQ